MTDAPELTLTRNDGKRLFYAGVAVGLFIAAAFVWDVVSQERKMRRLARPPKRPRVRVLYFMKDGTTQSEPPTFEQAPGNA